MTDTSISPLRQRMIEAMAKAVRTPQARETAPAYAPSTREGGFANLGACHAGLGRLADAIAIASWGRA